MNLVLFGVDFVTGDAATIARVFDIIFAIVRPTCAIQVKPQILPYPTLQGWQLRRLACGAGGGSWCRCSIREAALGGGSVAIAH
jgi:hypothetical protein